MKGIKTNTEANTNSKSHLDYSFFFKNIPDNLKSLFIESKNPWSCLQSDLKNFFSSTSDIKGEVSNLAHITGEGVVIEQGAVVDAFSYIQGPCFIGSGTHVRPGAYIRGYVYVGINCVVGHSTEIKHSILFDEAKAGHFNYIGDSVLGHNVNLGAGTKIANLKITSGNVIGKLNEEKIDTGLRKFGALLGDSCQTGCNSVLNPGTCLAKGSMVFPNSTASGIHTKKVIIR